MAAALSLVTLEEELTCAICLGIYTDPVVLECKHSFCRACIEEFWSGAAPGTYSCPECRAETSERPGLEKNFKLASIVQKYLALQSSQDAVLCNYCTESPLPAVKTCLKCEASLCPIHLKHHRENSVFKSHSLTELTTDLSLWKCPEHQKSLEIYCKDDKVCVCSLCALVGKHKNHNCSSISEGEKELRDHLQCQLERIRSNTEAVQAALNLHHKEKQNTQSEIQEAKCKVKEKYKLLKKSVEEEERKVLERLENEEKRVTEQTNTKIFQLENQLKESETSLAALTSVLKKNEELVFIQEFHSLANRLKDVSEPLIPPAPSLWWTNQFLKSWQTGFRSSTMQWLRCQLQGDVNRYRSVSHSVVPAAEIAALRPAVRVRLQAGEHMLLNQFIRQHSDGQTPSLDPDTANPKLILSNSNRTVSVSDRTWPIPNNVKRFDLWQQVLGSEGVSCGSSYWELQVTGSEWWGAGVCYGSLSRKGGGAECLLGWNKKSWILRSWGGLLTVRHNCKEIKLAAGMASKVGVFVDFEAGVISFYSVSGSNLTLLHTFQEQSFPESLYPALWVYDYTKPLSLCDLKQ
ncbi:E3 ubiquitin/ISG15 ligase TRIM25 [Callorhinchus milii]|uniref:E3 ubiquitin/ISG15 ligase TRIM25 n=1 Tax=Callorhinchus milii TaxID=7868 RepID=UPI001C3FD141|nr:E3 ubiquitin/ISG15 ligase TRIM25 [Callorhinchus milii]